MNNNLVDIAELRASCNRLATNTTNTDGQFNRLSQLLAGMSGVIGPRAALGQGINNLSQNTQTLAGRLRANLNQIESFLNARVAEAEAGTSASSSEIQALAADLQNINLT